MKKPLSEAARIYEQKRDYVRILLSKLPDVACLLSR